MNCVICANKDEKNTEINISEISINIQKVSSFIGRLKNA